MSPPKRVQRCAIYTRKSTEEGLEQEYNSLHAQRDSCEAYVKSQSGEGWVLIKTIYDDGGYSGGSMERPALQALLNDIDHGKIDVVVVYKVDRLTRSLADFAKIVERFDKRSVSFVSVTQSFNTTNSMGRLTLNVLLSFAQFEREVAGERIRDKLGASRRKGMWMGGSVPMGYDVKDRKLVPNSEAAEKVRHIFRRYVAIKSIQKLRLELKAEGITSQVRVHQSGRQRGGHAFSIGALTHLLKNRVYVGEVFFKDAIYPGQHDGIVEWELFDQVQGILEENRRLKVHNPTTKLDFPLVGRIFDDQGHPMTPSHTRKNAARRYRYYVSRALVEKDRGVPGSLPRVPASAIEDIVAGMMRKLIAETNLTPTGFDPHGASAAMDNLRKLEIGRESIAITLDKSRFCVSPSHASSEWRDALNVIQDRLGTGCVVELIGDDVVVSVRVKICVRHGMHQILMLGTNPVNSFAQPDRTLLKTIAQAHSWLAMLTRGEAHSVEALARTVRRDRPYVNRVLQLAFLNPSIAQCLMDGWQPAHLTASDLLETNIPQCWRRQFVCLRV
jgi:site-specific DNA recombinase